MTKKKPSSPTKPKDSHNFAVGGQAIIEGVMMRSKHFYTMAVRRESKEIVVESRQYISWTKRSKILALPLLRGVVVLGESVYLGMKALFFSNNIMMEDIDEAERKKGKKVKEKSDKKTLLQSFLGGLFWIAYFIFTFGMAIFLFKFLPLFVAEKATYFPVVDSHYWIFNLVDGMTKIAVFVGYLLLISLLPDIRRVFAYHGAEHQAIWAHEKGKKLTIKNAQEENPEHPRCGTSFIMLVLLLSIAVYTALPEENDFTTKLLERILVLPLIAGLSYEVLKVSAKYETKWWMHWVTLPGIWLQKITTKKPDDEMEEVAIAALTAALKAEEGFKG
jgi:uncharacterized protein YqhQ